MNSSGLQNTQKCPSYYYFAAKLSNLKLVQYELRPLCNLQRKWICLISKISLDISLSSLSFWRKGVKNSLKTKWSTKRGQKQLFLGVDKFCISLKLWSLHMQHSLYPYMIYDISKQHREYFPPFVGCLIHPELVKLTYIQWSQKKRKLSG